MINKIVNGVSFELKEPFDFDFLSEYGRVFAVFDDQDSGYLCFGVHNDNRKLFLKLAGAATKRSSVTKEEAIQRLKSTLNIYEQLRHPNLIDIIEHKEVKDGYLVVNEWFEGECMGRQYAAHERITALPLDDKMSIYQVILSFHSHVNYKGYIALDFYDGSIMYDFKTRRTMICDIEFYRKSPVINTMGRMWGSSRFMSPEEFQLGERIDERSNVFVMGATAFQLFGGGTERSFDKWEANAGLYAIALKAVSQNKDDRYPSIDAYIEAWNAER
ncbi:protein kinase domain-containing protein [Paenibacillus kobensis]|uniref:protein kinase domain-containing protein n=1 Tax=Paenibacillus kobensis TaxID=59841 RepID=UPI000FDA85AF|nr:protein kinase [Paenibacillus kobensis]